MLGPVEVRYALAVDDDDPYRLAADVLDPLLTTGSFGGGDRPTRGSALSVRGAEVSALRTERRPARSAGVQPVPHGRDGGDRGSLGLAGRPPRASRRSVRGEVRTPPRGDRHRPARRRLTTPAIVDEAGGGTVGQTGAVPGGRTPAHRPLPALPELVELLSTPSSRSHRTFLRRSAPGSEPARDSFHTWMRPMSFSVRVREGPHLEPVGHLPASSGAVPELLRGEHGAGIGHAHQPAGQVDDRAVEVTVLDQDRTEGQGHPHVGEQFVPGVGLGQAQPDGRGPGGCPAPRT